MSTVPAACACASRPARASPRNDDSSSTLPTHSMRRSSLRTRCPLPSWVSPLSPRWMLRSATAGSLHQLRVQHHQLADRSAPIRARIDVPPGRHLANVEVLVQLADEGRVAVREHQQATLLVEGAIQIRQFPLMFLAEKIACVGCEKGCLRARVVGRVEVDEVVLLRLELQKPEVLGLDTRPLELLGSPAQPFLVENARIGIPAERNIEYASAVDAVETIETGLVQIDEPGGLGDEGKRRLFAHGQEEVLVVSLLVLAQELDHLPHIIPHRLEGFDELAVVVPQNHLARFDHGLEVKENRAAAKEGFDITPDATPGWIEPRELRQKLSLAAGPLQERPKKRSLDL